LESVAEKQPVRVTILSRAYVLRTADDPRQVEALANSVNELMLSIASRAPNADSTHIAVLACLHLADRLRLLEHDLSSLKERVDRKSSEFAALLDQVVPASGPEPGEDA
jgi:cell division protein ZapA